MSFTGVQLHCSTHVQQDIVVDGSNTHIAVCGEDFLISNVIYGLGRPISVHERIKRFIFIISFRKVAPF